MPLLDLDLTDAQDFSLIDEGGYDAEVSGVSDTEQGPKAKFIIITYTITEEPYAGRELDRRYPVEGAGAGFLLEIWNKLTGEELTIGEMSQIDTDDLIGVACKIIVGHREYEDETYNDVKKVLAIK